MLGQAVALSNGEWQTEFPKPVIPARGTTGTTLALSKHPIKDII